MFSHPVKKKDHHEKTSGKAVYIDDLRLPDMHAGKIVRSTVPSGRIREIRIPPHDDSIKIVTAADIPGKNRVLVTFDDQIVLNDQEVRYIGEAILIVVAPDKKQAEDFAAAIQIDYDPLPACTDFRESCNAAHAYAFTKGDPTAALAGAADIFEETFQTGYHEHAYLEPQGMAADYRDGIINVYGSMQCPFYIHDALKLVFDFGDERVRVVQMTTGGGFGGKEDYASVIACQTAVASYAAGVPVKIVFDRTEDLTVTSKRHPSQTTYRTALDDSGRIAAMEIEIIYDSGAYPGCSSVVLQRGMLHSTGVYTIPNLSVRGEARLTNTVPTGAFRGFGAPQVMFAIETHMEHLAKKLGRNPLEFKQEYLAKTGDDTVTGGRYACNVPTRQMIDMALQESGYMEKWQANRQQTGRFRRGIGLSLSNHGCGFTGSAEQDFLKPVVKLKKYRDGRVEILIGSSDIGQGLKTVMCKIVAAETGVPLDNVWFDNPDTSRTANSGPTVASRSTMVVGRMLQKAAAELKAAWTDGEEHVVTLEYEHQLDSIPWDLDTFHGDAYPDFGWGLNICEVVVDTVSGSYKIERIHGIYDVGTRIDERIVKGQMQGGCLQGIGYGSTENIVQENGAIQQNRFSNFSVPTAIDAPVMETSFVDNYYNLGPFGAKGAGELPVSGSAPSFTLAVENALGQLFNVIPLTPERIMERFAEDV